MIYYPQLCSLPLYWQIPHNLHPTEKPKKTLGRQMVLILVVVSIDTMGKWDIFGYGGNAFHVDHTEVGILQKAG